MKKLIIFIIFLLLIYLGLTLAGLNPIRASRTDCHQYTEFTHESEISTMYATPNDVLSGSKQLLLKAECSKNTAYLSVEADRANQTVYKYGHFANELEGVWSEFVFNCEDGESGDWCEGLASATLSVEDLSKVNWAIAQVCTEINGVKYCGCRDTACRDSYWQIQKIQIK